MLVHEIPTIVFNTQKDWHEWLAANHSTSKGVWLRMYKKQSGKQSINYDEALDEALCFGWIDSQKKSYDESSWIQKFTPRGLRSMWSKRNREHVARLISEKRMTPAGLAQISEAKKDGRWNAAYDSPKNMQVPHDFLNELKKDKVAYQFYQTLNNANIYAIAWRLQTAKKPETRARRMEALLKMLAEGRKLH